MPSPIGALREAAAAWICGAANSSEVVRRAADLLSTGDNDSISLPIAVLPPQLDRADLLPILEQVFEDAGDIAALRGDRMLELALRWQCAQHLAGTITGRELTAWAHATSNHEGPLAFESFALLDDEFDDGVMTEDAFAAALDKAIHEHLARTAAYVSDSCG